MGGANLRRHVENLRRFGVPVVVAINRFPGDTEAELAAVCEIAREAGAHKLVLGPGCALPSDTPHHLLLAAVAAARAIAV